MKKKSKRKEVEKMTCPLCGNKTLVRNVTDHKNWEGKFWAVEVCVGGRLKIKDDEDNTYEFDCPYWFAGWIEQ